jgi:hypothetical protein
MGALQCGTVVGKYMIAQPIKGYALQKAGGDDSIGVDVVAHQWDGAAFDLLDFAGHDGALVECFISLLRRGDRSH